MKGKLDIDPRYLEQCSIHKTNRLVDITDNSGKKTTVLYDSNKKQLRKVNMYNPQFNDMKTSELRFYNDLLTDPNINTIIVDGLPGTGKTSTLCAHLVDGLHETKTIPRAFITKPHESLGKSYGHLPGDLDSKTKFEFKSFYQYFDRFGQPMLADKLMGNLPTAKGGKPQHKILDVVVFEYLRGIDIDSGWVVLDEAQNASPKEILALITRVGDKAKLIVMGDSSQFQKDRRQTGESGLEFAKQLYSDKSYAGIVEMQSYKHVLRGRRVKDALKYIEKTGM